MRATHSLSASLFFLALLGLLLAMPPGAVRADDVPRTPEEEDRLEDIEYQTERGLKAFGSGNHEEVLARMKRLAETGPEEPAARSTSPGGSTSARGSTRKRCSVATGGCCRASGRSDASRRCG